jgi:hypothetical protein
VKRKAFNDNSFYPVHPQINLIHPEKSESKNEKANLAVPGSFFNLEASVQNEGEPTPMFRTSNTITGSPFVVKRELSKLSPKFQNTFSKALPKPILSFAEA